MISGVPGIASDLIQSSYIQVTALAKDVTSNSLNGETYDCVSNVPSLTFLISGVRGIASDLIQSSYIQVTALAKDVTSNSLNGETYDCVSNVPSLTFLISGVGGIASDLIQSSKKILSGKRASIVRVMIFF